MKSRRPQLLSLSIEAWALLLLSVAAISALEYSAYRKAGEKGPSLILTPDPIEKEIKDGSAVFPWVGRYQAAFSGLDISPAHWRTTSYALYEPDPGAGQRGSVHQAGSHLRLTGGGNDGWAPPSDLVIVPWGPRMYLVPADRLIFFAADVNAGIEPRTDGGFKSHAIFLRNGDEKKEAPGRPSLPNSFQRYLADREISAKVLRFEPFSQKKGFARLVINAGRKQGIFEGLAFHARRAKTDILALASTVRENESMLIYFYCEGDPLKKGFELTTGKAPAL